MELYVGSEWVIFFYLYLGNLQTNSKLVQTAIFYLDLPIANTLHLLYHIYVYAIYVIITSKLVAANNALFLKKKILIISAYTS